MSEHADLIVVDRDNGTFKRGRQVEGSMGRAADESIN